MLDLIYNIRYELSLGLVGFGVGFCAAKVLILKRKIAAITRQLQFLESTVDQLVSRQ